jgi:DNA-binding GntR family transcriptional regulator
MAAVRARRVTRVPIYVRVADELEGAMLRGEYGPGDRLPTEHALAERHGVNRHTAGQALNHLQDKGLVYRVRGRGSFVRPGRIDYRVAEKMSFSDSVRRLGLSAAQEILGVRNVRARGKVTSRMGVPEGEPLVALERVRYAGEVPLVYGTKHLREALFPGIYHLLEQGCRSVRALVRTRYGLEVYRARSTFEIEPADEENSRYLGVQLGAPLLRVESLDTLEDGTPAEWGVSYFRGDATRVEVTLRETEERD